MSRRMEAIHESGGNVFADLRVADAEEMRLKAEMVVESRRLMISRKLSKTATAKMVGLEQADLSELLSGGLRGYSVERLLKMLTAFGQEVTSISRPRTATGVATISFTALASETP